MSGKRKRLQNRKRSQVRAIDVARLSGCSTATVSRVQNTPDRVAPETRKRVLAAIRKLNYMPNSAARALRSESSRMIGIVIPTLSHAIYATLVDSAERRLAADGYSLLVATFEYDLAKEAQQISMLVERGTEGLILVGEDHVPEVYRLLDATGVPYINTYVFSPVGPHPCIGIDNRRASFDIASFLCSLGHRDFGVISAPYQFNDRAAGRVRGIRDGLAAHGISLPDDAVVERPYSIDGGRDGLRLLRSRRYPPSAIICGNDVLAFGALIECREMGLSVPEELSVVGFDNLDFAPHLDPALTTMEVPAGPMGEGAAEFILDALRDRTRLDRIRLEPKLIARRSTGIPAAARSFAEAKSTTA